MSGRKEKQHRVVLFYSTEREGVFRTIWAERKEERGWPSGEVVSSDRTKRCPPLYPLTHTMVSSPPLIIITFIILFAYIVLADVFIHFLNKRNHNQFESHKKT
jgi:hypothetical protein